jgi:hypothetical protein
VKGGTIRDGILALLLAAAVASCGESEPTMPERASFAPPEDRPEVEAAPLPVERGAIAPAERSAAAPAGQGRVAPAERKARR